MIAPKGEYTYMSGCIAKDFLGTLQCPATSIGLTLCSIHHNLPPDMKLGDTVFMYFQEETLRGGKLSYFHLCPDIYDIVTLEVTASIRNQKMLDFLSRASKAPLKL